VQARRACHRRGRWPRKADRVVRRASHITLSHAFGSDRPFEAFLLFAIAKKIWLPGAPPLGDGVVRLIWILKKQILRSHVVRAALTCCAKLVSIVHGCCCMCCPGMRCMPALRMSCCEFWLVGGWLVGCVFFAAPQPTAVEREFAPCAPCAPYAHRITETEHYEQRGSGGAAPGKKTGKPMSP
jgi:hypothetical protein